MARPGQKLKWIVDAVLLLGFLAALALDVTGLPLHQWLGVGIAALASYHLLVHRDWVASVTRRFFGQTGGRARLYYAIDAALLLGLLAITVSGLVISTWLNLPLANYEAWRVTHVAASLASLWLAVVKLGLHWRWIAAVARRHVLPAIPAARTPAPVPATVPASTGRRDFLKLVGGVGTLAALATASVLDDRADALAPTAVVYLDSPTATATPSATAEPTASASAAATATDSPGASATGTETATAVASATPTAVAATATVQQATTCTVRCPRGCSYPGQCRRYVDSDGNKKCDLGECL
ncbi:MAG: hypothetical protein ACYC5O_04935 [Anaerolineae bacterium]